MLYARAIYQFLPAEGISPQLPVHKNNHVACYYKKIEQLKE